MQGECCDSMVNRMERNPQWETQEKEKVFLNSC